MRKFLMLSLLAGSAALGISSAADAAPVAGFHPLVQVQDAQVQTVQYRCGPRCREEIRRREWRRRHEERRYDRRYDHRDERRRF